MPTTVISGRVDDAIRLRADVVLRKAGLKSTDIIQNVWAFMAKTGEVPEAAQPSAAAADDRQEALSRLDSFINSLPPADSAYASWSDEDILALRVSDYA